MIHEITVQELKTKLDNKEKFVLIDVRRSDELAICKLDQALHIEMNLIPLKINELEENAEYVIMCRSGARSMQICRFLEQKGFINLSNLKGGILEWGRVLDPNMPSY